ncbi:MAG: PepSY-associated TM helix domain-containing protein [Congregibacter sp.]
MQTAESQRRSSANRVRSAMSAHGIMGVAIAAMLYLVALSGTVSVFKDELEVLEQFDHVPRVDALDDQALIRAAEDALSAETGTAHLLIYLPTIERKVALVATDNAEYYLDASGAVATTKFHPWTDFIIDLHYYLNLPHSFGMIVVATFGVLLFSMSISGVLAHPNIFKDAFTFRIGRSPRLTQTDIHNRLGVWTLPFHVTNSLTGAMIGLASLSALAVASLNYEGDTTAVFAPVFGGEPAVNAEPAGMARFDKALKHLRENYAYTQPVLIVLHDPQTRGQYLQVYAEHPERLIFAEKYNYNGAGEFLGTVGSADGHLGQQVADSVYKVHFGSFGGMPVKIAYVLFGVSLMLIINGGMRVYFFRCVARGRSAGMFLGAWNGLAVGAPILMALGFALSQWISLTQAGYLTIFWCGLALCIAFGLGHSASRVSETDRASVTLLER